MDLISQIRRWMADENFSEAQRVIEVQLALDDLSIREELLMCYHAIMHQQDKSLPGKLTIELAEKKLEVSDVDSALQLIENLSKNDFKIFERKILLMKISIASLKGKTEELYQFVSDFQFMLFERSTPAIPDAVNRIIDKYFKNDFHLGLQRLALLLVRGDLIQGQNLVKELILSGVEQSSPKRIRAKLMALSSVLKGYAEKNTLEIYYNYCELRAHGVTEKKDYKKIIELIIYEDDFRFQVLILDLLVKFEIEEESKSYALVLRCHPAYDFVYFDKYFSHLKRFFVDMTPQLVDEQKTAVKIDLELFEDFHSEALPEPLELDFSDDELRFSRLLKHQAYSTAQLNDLAVGFLQSDMPRVALEASEIAVKNAHNDEAFLKASYLKLTCLLLLKDYRAALDTALEALGRAQTEDDVLSFLYGQAEVLLRLNQKKDAKKILSKIYRINSKYRLTRERLESLDEI